MPPPQKSYFGMFISRTFQPSLQMAFNDYAITLWGLPDEFARNPDPARIKTNAKEFALAKKTNGEYHLVLIFDLKPDLLLKVELLKAGQQ